MLFGLHELSLIILFATPESPDMKKLDAIEGSARGGASAIRFYLCSALVPCSNSLFTFLTALILLIYFNFIDIIKIDESSGWSNRA